MNTGKHGDPKHDKQHPGKDENPTYQESLDDQLEDTFPASDPISPGTGSRPGKPVKTSKDDKDWKLEPQHPPKK